MLDVYNDKCIVELHLYSMSYLKSSKSLMVSKVNDSVFKLHLFHNLRGVELKQKNDMYVYRFESRLLQAFVVITSATFGLLTIFVT